MLHGWEIKNFRHYVCNILFGKNSQQDNFPACNAVLDEMNFEKNVLRLGRGLLVHGYRECSLTVYKNVGCFKSPLLLRTKFIACLSQNILCIQLNCFTQSNKAIYYACPLKVAVSVFFLVVQITRVPWIEMIQPEVNFRVSLQPPRSAPQ